MKVEAELKLYFHKGEITLGIVGKEWKLNELADTFNLFPDKVIDLVASIEEKEEKKSDSQMGYYWGVIAPAARSYFSQLGWNCRTKEKASDLLLEQLDYCDILENNITKQRFVIPPSLSSFGVKKLGRYIEEAFTFLVSEGVVMMTAEEYKKIKKL